MILDELRALLETAKLSQVVADKDEVVAYEWDDFEMTHTKRVKADCCSRDVAAVLAAAVNALPKLLDALEECAAIARERTTAWSGAIGQERKDGHFGAREDEARYILRAIESTIATLNMITDVHGR